MDPVMRLRGIASCRSYDDIDPSARMRTVRTSLVDAADPVLATRGTAATSAKGVRRGRRLAT